VLRLRHIKISWTIVSQMGQEVKQVSKLKDRIVSVDVLLRGLAMFLILSTQIGGARIWSTLFDLIRGEKNRPQFITSQMSWRVAGSH
jgi:hypothetical protein